MKREKKLWKKYPQLVFLIISSLGLYLPVYGSIVLDDGTPDLTNMINQNFTVSSGESVTTCHQRQKMEDLFQNRQV